jgi:hypothetical protein
MTDKQKVALVWLHEFVKNGDSSKTWMHAIELKRLFETLAQQILILTQRIENHEEALDKIACWCEAYPEDLFTPLNDKLIKVAGVVLKDTGIDIGALHAQWARHLLKEIDHIAVTALNGSEHEGAE